MSKTLRDPKTGTVRTVDDTEADKLFKSGWKYTSRYEQKRIAAMLKAKAERERAA